MATDKRKRTPHMIQVEAINGAALSDKMRHIALYQPKLEPVMMSLAKAAGMNLTVKHLDNMRKYVKRVRNG